MKTARKIVSIIYALSSLVLVYIIVMSAIYSLTKIGTNETSIGIIGGADGPTAKFITGKLFGIGGIGFILFPFSVVSFNIANLISAFSKKQYKAFNIALLIWNVFSSLLLLMIPSQSTVIAKYILYRPIIDTFWCYLFMRIISPENIFFISSLVLIVLSVLELINLKKESTK